MKLYLYGLIGPVRDSLAQNGLLEKLGTDKQFLNVNDVVVHHQNNGKPYLWKKEVIQTNIDS